MHVSELRSTTAKSSYEPSSLSDKVFLNLVQVIDNDVLSVVNRRKFHDERVEAIVRSLKDSGLYRSSF
jgi:hypothetical protein